MLYAHYVERGQAQVLHPRGLRLARDPNRHDVVFHLGQDGANIVGTATCAGQGLLKLGNTPASDACGLGKATKGRASLRHAYCKIFEALERKYNSKQSGNAAHRRKNSFADVLGSMLDLLTLLLQTRLEPLDFTQSLLAAGR